jgi:hypothetical protein
MQDSDMIADEIQVVEKYPELTDSKDETTRYIKESIINAIVPFKKSILEINIKGNLNENKLTQIFVQCIEYQIRRLCENIAVNCQYHDIFFNTKGVTDFYFYRCEETQKHTALFVVESKRLPPPSKKAREKEYVIGENNNGGIERYKIEKHGKGFCECGMLGFVEKQTFQYWQKTINLWIENIAKNDNNWKNDEILKMNNYSDDYCQLSSIIHRYNSDTDITLYHWWIQCRNV